MIDFNKIKTAINTYIKTNGLQEITGSVLNSVLNGMMDAVESVLKVFQTDLGGKVDKVDGKGLSSNDFSDAEKSKLSALQNYDDTSLRNELQEKQDVIDDLAQIRNNAAKGATALQEIPEGYVTADELSRALNDKQDVIADLAEIRNGAYKGATALQSVPEGYVKQEDLAEINNAIGELADEVNALAAKEGVVNITYAELKALRDAGQLKAGMLYRITDFVTTTSQENTLSAGHQFDIIVLATDNKTLSERAWAAVHDGDEHFKDCNLAAWQIWYCLDNDETRFAWALYPYAKVAYSLTKGPFQTNGSSEINAHNKVIEYNGTRYLVLFNNYGFDYCVSAEDVAKGSGVVYAHNETLHDAYGTFEVTEKQESEGKGVIYRMIDEWNNDIPYDFKNIQYEENVGFGYSQWGNQYVFSRNESLDKVIDGIQYYGYSSPATPSAWSNGNCLIVEEVPSMSVTLYREDGSTISFGGSITSVSTEYRKFYTFAGNSDLHGVCYGNDIKPYLDGGVQNLNKICFGEGCHSNVFGNGCHDNSFGEDCHSNVLGNECHSNSFGDFCSFNSFGTDCNFNVSGDWCISNVFGNSCDSNSFGEDCTGNSFGTDCSYNSYGNFCSYNSFGNSCGSNSFGDSCFYNSFGNGCDSNSFGNNCDSNSFGNYCDSNSFGNYCNHNKFAEDCESNSFAEVSSDRKGNYFYYNEFDAGVKEMYLMALTEGTDSSIKAQHYHVMSGVSNHTLAFSRNQKYVTLVARKTDGTITWGNIADLW